MRLREPYRKKFKKIVTNSAMIIILSTSGYMLVNPADAPTPEEIYESANNVEVEVLGKHIKTESGTVKDTDNSSEDIDLLDEEHRVSVYYGGQVYDVEVTRSYYLSVGANQKIQAYYSHKYGEVLVDTSLLAYNK